MKEKQNVNESISDLGKICFPPLQNFSNKINPPV